MCIICLMREAGASEEVMDLANELKDAFDTSMLIHQEVLNEDRKHSAKEVAALYGMRDAIAKDNSSELDASSPEALKASIEKMLGRKVTMVEIKPEQDLNDQINKVMGSVSDKLH